MDYVEKFSILSDSIIRNHSQIFIPEKNQSQDMREQKFKDYYHSLTSKLDELLIKLVHDLVQQSIDKNEIITIDQLKQMGNIGMSKIRQLTITAREHFDQSSL